MKPLTIIVAIGFAAVAVVLFATRSGSVGGVGGASGWQIQTSSDGYSAWKINGASGVTYFCDARSRACYAIGFKD